MTASTWNDTIDHRDPTWQEGRDYQRVCGFETDSKNLRLCSVGENSRKSNRFVPWRVDSRFPPPEEPGDWAWFLNLETEQWEFTQWLGERWWQLTHKHCGEYYAGVNRKGKPYTRNPEVISNFVEFHERRQLNPHLNEKFIEICRKNGKEQGAKNGRKNKGRKHSAEVNARKGSSGEFNPMYGKVRCTNGFENKQVDSEDLIPPGYWRGMTRFNK